VLAVADIRKVPNIFDQGLSSMSEVYLWQREMEIQRCLGGLVGPYDSATYQRHGEFYESRTPDDPQKVEPVLGLFALS